MCWRKGVSFAGIYIQVKCQNISSKYFQKIPKEVELQDLYLTEKVNSLRDSPSNEPRATFSELKQKSKDSEVLQQFGLNDKISSSHKTYFRYMIGSHFEYDSPSEYIEIKKEFKRDFRGTSIFFANILKKELEKTIDCNNGCTFSKLVGDTCIINGFIAVPVVFSRKSNLNRFKDQEIKTTIYIVPTNKKIYYIRTSYLKFQESIWLPIIKQLNNSINLK